MTIHYGLIQVQKSITKVLRIVSKVFRYQVQSTWNRIELILQVSPTPRITKHFPKFFAQNELSLRDIFNRPPHK